MVKTIYTLPFCHKCEKIKKLYPEAKVIKIELLNDEESDYIFSKASESNILSAPIVLDENENIIFHGDLGI